MPYAHTPSAQKTAPRPILKRGSCSSTSSSGSLSSSLQAPSPLHIPRHNPAAQHGNHSSGTGSPKVHFPPSTVVADTFVAHSASVYDRTPIRVAPNTCALPARGCPGRTYGPGSDLYALSDSDSDERDGAVFYEDDEEDEDEDEQNVNESTPGRAWRKAGYAAPAKMRVRGFDVRLGYGGGSSSSDSLRSDGPAIQNARPAAFAYSSSGSSTSNSEDSDGFLPFLNGTFANMQMSYSPPSQTSHSSPRGGVTASTTPTQLAFLPHPNPHAHAHSHSQQHAYSPPTPKQRSFPLSSSNQSSPHSSSRQKASPRSPVRSKGRGSSRSPIRSRTYSSSQGYVGECEDDEGCLGGF